MIIDPTEVVTFFSIHLTKLRTDILHIGMNFCQPYSSKHLPNSYFILAKETTKGKEINESLFGEYASLSQLQYISGMPGCSHRCTGK